MKKILFLSALFSCNFSYAQIIKTAGIPYTPIGPTHIPSSSGSSWAIDTTNLDLWSYYNNTWNLAGEMIQTISGCTAPAYTPGKGQSLWVVNGCDSLYYFRSGQWRHIDNQTLSIDSAIVGSNERFALSISNGNTVRFDVPQTTNLIKGSGTANRVAFWASADSIKGDSTLRFFTNTTDPVLWFSRTSVVDSAMIRFSGETNKNHYTIGMRPVQSYFGGSGNISNHFTIRNEFRNQDALLIGLGSGDNDGNIFLNAYAGQPRGGNIALANNGNRVRVFMNYPLNDTLPISNDAVLNIRGYTAQDTAYGLMIHNSTGTNNALTVRNDTRVGIATATPNRTLQVSGEVRITDLQTDNPTRLLAADADGDVNQAILGNNLSWSGDTLNAAIGSITGTGVTNALAKWSGSNTLTSSLIKDNGITIDLSAPTGLGITPTAILHLKAGTAAANTAPLKFTSGTLMTNPEAGSIEYEGNHLLFTDNTPVRYTMAKGLYNSADLNFPSTNSQESSDLTITVTGALDGDVVSLGFPSATVEANTTYTAWVSATNTVTVRFNNYSTSSVDPSEGKFTVYVLKL